MQWLLFFAVEAPAGMADRLRQGEWTGLPRSDRLAEMLYSTDDGQDMLLTGDAVMAFGEALAFLAWIMPQSQLPHRTSPFSNAPHLLRTLRPPRRPFRFSCSCTRFQVSSATIRSCSPSQSLPSKLTRPV